MLSVMSQGDVGLNSWYENMSTTFLIHKVALTLGIE